MARRKPRIASRRAALILGYGGILVGACALYDAYECRGKERPFAARFPALLGRAMDPILSAGQLGAVSLVVVDYPNDIERQAQADATGTAFIEIDAVPAGFLWRIERMTTFVSDHLGNLITNPPAGALFNLYKVDGGQATPLPMKFRDGSQSPGLDVADESSPIVIQAGLSALPYWTGLTPGTFGNIAIQYQLVAKLTGVTSS